MNHYKKAFVVSVAIAIVSAYTYAEKHDENDALAIAQAKVSLAQAVNAAEQTVSGKATHAEFEKGKTGWVYKVEIVDGTKVFDVTVDANKGTVISSTVDLEDDEHHDRKH